MVFCDGLHLLHIFANIFCTATVQLLHYLWDQLRSKDCTDNFTANATDSSLPRSCCNVDKKYDKREPVLFKEVFRCAEMLCLCSKTYCCYDKETMKHTFSSRGLNKRTLKSVAMVDQCQSIAKC